MRVSTSIIVSAVVFGILGLIAAWCTVSFLDLRNDADEVVPIVFILIPVGSVTLGVIVAFVAVVVGGRMEKQVSSDPNLT